MSTLVTLQLRDHELATAAPPRRRSLNTLVVTYDKDGKGSIFDYVTGFAGKLTGGKPALTTGLKAIDTLIPSLPSPKTGIGSAISQGIGLAGKLASGGSVSGKDVASMAVTGLTLVNPVIGGAAAALLGAAEAMGLSFETKSVAGWDRTIGRFYRAGAPKEVTRALYRLAKPTDKTGAALWELAVDFVGIPTAKTKNQTKKGYTRDSPIPIASDGEIARMTGTNIHAYLAYVKS